MDAEDAQTIAGFCLRLLTEAEVRPKQGTELIVAGVVGITPDELTALRTNGIDVLRGR